MTHSPQTYQAYMLRLWRDGGQAPWRASLESTADGQVTYFGSLPELVRFLEDSTHTVGQEPGDAPPDQEDTAVGQSF